jgi:hypothetical protein
LAKVELAASKDTLNSNTKEPFDVAHLAQAIELNKLLFKLLEVFLVIRIVEDDDIVHVEEEDDPIVYLKAWKALNRV